MGVRIERKEMDVDRQLPCTGGALVGSRRARQWYAKGGEEADLKKLKFAEAPAFNAYFNSLVNLGCFITDDELPDTDEDAEEPEFTFDDIELSDLGLDLARQYDSSVARLSAVRQVSSAKRKCSVKTLREWGKRGGLCELADPSSPDRELLRRMFLAKIDLPGESHAIRRQSLLLILELCRQLSADDWIMSETTFASAIYFGELVSGDDHLHVEWPQPLQDIAFRWRMFYFHHYMSVALEGMFSWVVIHLQDKGVAGATVDELITALESAVVRRNLSQLLGITCDSRFSQMTPAKSLTAFGVSPRPLDAELSLELDMTISAKSIVAEERLEEIIRSNKYLYSPTGLAIPMVLLALTLARYTQWDGTNYGNWLADVADDPYVDLIPPVLTNRLAHRFGDWWNCGWKELTAYVLSRCVIRQHIAMSYEKTSLGERCLLEYDGDKVMSRFSFEKIGMGNARFNSRTALH